MEKEMVGNVPSNILGTLEDILCKLRKGAITFDELKRFAKRENPFAGLDFSSILADWQSFYKKEVFGKNMDFSNVRIPEKPEGNWRLLIIANINLETLYAKCKEKFPCRRWTDKDFDNIIVDNERDAKSGPYAIWVRDEVEADENLKNKSANDIKATGVKTETLAERLIHELKYFMETGSHLDIKNVTLCSGSRYTDGRVPSVYWHDYKMNVNWHYPFNAYGSLRSRQAVS